MPRTPAQNQAIKDRRRGKLLEAAIKVFARLGYDDVSVDSITNQARCSHGLFYHYFDSKEDIFRALYNEIILPLHLFAQDKAAVAENFPKAFAKMIKDIETADQRTMLIIQVAIRAREARTIDRANTDIRVRFDPILTYESAIIESQKKGEFVDGDPHQLALILAALFYCSALAAIEKNGLVIASDALEQLFTKK